MLNKLMINTYITNHHNFLGFNPYDIKNFKIKNKLIKIKKIQSQNCNKSILEKIIFKHIKLNIHTFDDIQNNNVYIKYINNLLKKLKSSGYISCIKMFDVNTKNNKCLTLNIKTNPIVKKITILNYKKLKIPSHFLKNVLKKHLGMPRNYHLINDSFNLIYLWYKSKGFAWISIELIEQDMLNTNNIAFNIIEGLVKDVKLICRTKNTHNPPLLKFLNSLIKQELGIYSGSILNINRIERGIKHLINLHLIQNCNYIIKRDKTEFIVIIKYDICKNNIAYSYNYSSILNNYSNYKRIYNLLSEYLTRFKFFSRQTLYTRKSHIFSSIIQIDQALSYRYKSFYRNNRIHSFFTDFAILNNHAQLGINFSHPYIYKKEQNKTFSHLKMNLNNKIIKNYLCYPFIVLHLNGLSINQKSDLLAYLYRYIFSIQYNLLNSISMLHKGWYIYNKLIQINLCIKDYQLNTCRQQKSFRGIGFIDISKLLKSIKYQLIYLQISIKHNNFYNWNRLQNGQFIKIYSKLLTYIKTNHNNNWHKLVYLNQNIKIQYMQVFKLPKIGKDIYYHLFIIFAECQFSINSHRYEPIFYSSYNQVNNLFIKENPQKKSGSSCFHILNIEYHISKIKHLSIYFFFNHIDYLDNQKQHKPYIKAINNIYKYNIQIGSGIKFYIPIKKLPDIKLEYSIDNKGEYFLRLRTDSKYNE